MQRFRIFLIGSLTVLAVVLLGTMVVGAQDDREQANKEVVARIVDEAFNQGIYDVFDEAFAEAFVSHAPEGDGDAESFKGLIMASRAAFPDLQATADPVIAEGEWVALRFVMNGTFQNELVMPPQVFPPTGEPVQLTVNVLMRFNADGQLAEEWDESDNLSWWTQLGIIPPMEEPM
jgi:predicted ester cyclase